MTPGLPERGPDAGTMDQVRPHVRSWHSTTLPKIGRPILSNPIRWRPARRPRTEARPRRTDISRVKKGIDKPRPVTEADILHDGSIHSAQSYETHWKRRLLRSVVCSRGKNCRDADRERYEPDRCRLHDDLPTN